MWLINASSLKLELVYGDSTPKYAVLSHSWGLEEVSLAEFNQAHDDTDVAATIRAKAGYKKIVDACNKTKLDGFNYIWIDTCCIDKSSSAELTEAINSMFAWYRDSEVCYSLLSDLDSDLGQATDSQIKDALASCRWFTRGWCLQELLAPRMMLFFNRHWGQVGDRNNLTHIISDITGVPQSLLTSPPQQDLQDFPIAERISWIAHRKTTRKEDMAYSLLGLLDINMPMLYGEGDKAFIRLQEEVIKKYNDFTIFAWQGKSTVDGDFMPILAPSPANFAGFAAVKQETEQPRSALGRVRNQLAAQFSLSNKGVMFENVWLYSQKPARGFRHHYILFLVYADARFRGVRQDGSYLILQKVSPGLYVRLEATPERMKAFADIPIMDPCIEPVCILNSVTPTMAKELVRWERHAVRLRWRAWDHKGKKYWHIRSLGPRANWDVEGGEFLVHLATEQYMYIEFVPGSFDTNPNSEYFVLVIYVGGTGRKRDTSQIVVNIVDRINWSGVNSTPFKFAYKESLAMQEGMYGPVGDNRQTIEMAGCKITMTVSPATESDGTPYHAIFLDWESQGPVPSLARARSEPWEAEFARADIVGGVGSHMSPMQWTRQGKEIESRQHTGAQLEDAEMVGGVGSHVFPLQRKPQISAFEPKRQRHTGGQPEDVEMVGGVSSHMHPVNQKPTVAPFSWAQSDSQTRSVMDALGLDRGTKTKKKP
ncbi:hypothetical protein VHEMI05889 [[Torrubiella] hemipterigena]|uniref:Heterokaryon incompatibility domain-containing protein n=1 Tax=[Torrubiella] hemipterigena TaxID=1531966 RepID=A0A0A1TJV3_9HYPO|nr:hypothetical protein VHEMI05889 [[Torrubiella] hemipterigena]